MHAYRLAQHVRLPAEKDAHFTLKVQEAGGAELAARLGIGLVSLQLPLWPYHRGAADHHGRGATVIGHGQMQPVGLQGVLRRPEHAAAIVRVLARSVEVCEVADVGWQVHLRGSARHERAVSKARRIPKVP